MPTVDELDALYYPSGMLRESPRERYPAPTRAPLQVEIEEQAGRNYLRFNGTLIRELPSKLKEALQTAALESYGHPDALVHGIILSYTEKGEKLQCQFKGSIVTHQFTTRRNLNDQLRKAVFTRLPIPQERAKQEVEGASDEL